MPAPGGTGGDPPPRLLGDLYLRVFSRAMERDVEPQERAALRHLLHDLSCDIRAAHGSRRRAQRHSGLLASLICEAIDERIHGREEGY